MKDDIQWSECKTLVPPHHFQTDQQEIIKTTFLVFNFQVQVESQGLYKFKEQVVKKVNEVDSSSHQWFAVTSGETSGVDHARRKAHIYSDQQTESVWDVVIFFLFVFNICMHPGILGHPFDIFSKRLSHRFYWYMSSQNFSLMTYIIMHLLWTSPFFYYLVQLLLKWVPPGNLEGVF